MSRPGSYKQFAERDLSIKVRPGSDHCGLKVVKGHVAVNVRVEVHYGPDPLDERGFLVDAATFVEMFDKLESDTIDISCERLCQHIVETFVDMMPMRLAGSCESFVVRVTNANGVGVEWVSSDN